MKTLLIALFFLQCVYADPLMILPPNDARSGQYNAQEYSDAECLKIAQSNIQYVYFYSAGCNEKSNSDMDGNYTRLSNIDDGTLAKLVTRANGYWCEGLGSTRSNCLFTTQNSQQVNKMIQVCAVNSFNAADDKNKIAITYRNINDQSPNNQNGINIMIYFNMAKVDNIVYHDGITSFEAIAPSEHTNSKVSMADVFAHEAGHAVFGLNHPSNDVQSIMHANVQSISNTMEPDDKNFMYKCIGARVY